MNKIFPLFFGSSKKDIYSNINIDRDRGILYTIINFILTILVFVCIFDPFDKSGLKVFLFCAAGAMSLFFIKAQNQRTLPYRELLLYILFFIAIPVISIVWYMVINGAKPYEGFSLLKGFLFIILALVLVLSRVDILQRLSIILSFLSLLIITTFVVIKLNPDLSPQIRDFGMFFGIFILYKITYIKGVELQQVYYITSPMLVIPISYYISKALICKKKIKKSSRFFGIFSQLIKVNNGLGLQKDYSTAPPMLGIPISYYYWILATLNIVGMFLAGTRNNIFISMLLPLVLIFYFSKRKLLLSSIALIILSFFAMYYSNYIYGFFSIHEYSNSVKINYIYDYIRIFSNPLTLLFGQGLGSYEYFQARNKFNFITELTYLELIRYFGLIGTFLMITLLLFPIWRIFNGKRSQTNEAIAIGYLFYLVMCATNPNLFNSMGIMIISIILSRIYTTNEAE